jgi:hypothetical protein
MDEIPLWLWQYTDDFGKRRVTRYRLTEEEARARLVDPVKVEASSRSGSRAGRPATFCDIAAEVLAGRHFECTWELFRLQPPPGWRVAARSAPGVTLPGRRRHPWGMNSNEEKQRANDSALAMPLA